MLGFQRSAWSGNGRSLFAESKKKNKQDSFFSYCKNFFAVSSAATTKLRPLKVNQFPSR